MEKDVLIVGAGIFGLTLAERIAGTLDKNVLVIDKRDHIGGNAYSEIDKETGIECHKYGAHLFHTSNETVWRYVNKFTKFTDYTHRVYTTHKGEVYPMPINLGTINQYFRSNYSPNDARQLIKEQSNLMGKTPANLAEQGVSLIGKPLFDAFIKNYTAKQWQMPAEDLSPDIIKRLPVRYTFDNRYFSDTHEGLPVGGYEALFQEMVNQGNQNSYKGGGSIDLRLGTDYFKDEKIIKMKKAKIFTIYTGPIDRYFDFKYGELAWRSLDFQKEIIRTDDFQGCPVMNYADLNPKYTRIHEFKHFHPERIYYPKKWPGYSENSKKTIIVKEYSKTWKQGDEPYYPVNTAEDRKKLEKYNALSAEETNVVFGGRLGEYAYYDMDKTFAAALRAFDKIKKRAKK